VPELSSSDSERPELGHVLAASVIVLA
jgi:hypothetical protein